MRVMKKLLILTIILCASVAQAALLPYSSLYQGRSYFPTSTLSGWVDFAVYDRNSGEYADAPGEGQYIYAYQIFVDYASFDPLEYFAIYRTDGTAINGITSIDAQDDGFSGIEPDMMYYSPNETRGVWEFENGLLVGGEHSWFLVFSSNNSYTAGKYTVIKTSGDNDIPIEGGDHAPEPASLAMMAIGALWMSLKRKKSRLL